MSELKRFDIIGKYRDEVTMVDFRPDGDCYDADEVDAAIAELKAKLEDVQATACTESVDAVMRERKLHRALWLARAERAATWQVHWALCHNRSIEREFSIIGAVVPDDKHTAMKPPREWAMIWKRIYNKCRAKAEEYK